MRVGWEYFLRWRRVGSLGLCVWLREVRCIGYIEVVPRVL